MRETTRRSVLAATVTGSALGLAGCLEESTGSSSGSATGGRDGDAREGDRSADGAGDQDGNGDESDDEYADSTEGIDLPTADDRAPLEYDLQALRDGVLSGGVPKDGIPSIDEPSFEPADAADDRLGDGDPVFGVVRDGEARAYPQSILVLHEIVNDEIGGENVAVTYCPLTGTALGFERGEVELGVSGRLLDSNLVMYDRATDSRWPQMLATAIEGPFEGESLREFRVVWSRWDRWREAHPSSLVLTRDTGYVRDYAGDPYGSYNPRKGYYVENSSPMFAPLSTDDRLPPKRMVLGARPDEGALAVARSALQDRGVVEIDRDDSRFLAVRDPQVDTGHLYRNPAGESFTYDDFVTDADGERHDPGDLPLERVYAYDAMWFAWAGFYPSTTVHP